MESDADQIEVTTSIADGRTVVEVSGDRDVALVVRSASGEGIYLPPGEDQRPPPGEDSPYRSAAGAGESPYSAESGAEGAYESPYEASNDGTPEQRRGLEPTATGFRVVHPEPVTDLRVLRG